MKRMDKASNAAGWYVCDSMLRWVGVRGRMRVGIFKRRFRWLPVAGILFLGVGDVAWGQTADTVDWYLLSGLNTVLYQASGQEIVDRTGLLFQLIADPDKNTDFAALLAAGNGLTGWAIGDEHPTAVDYGASDDVVLDSTDWLTDSPHIEGNFPFLRTSGGTILNETPFYFRWFNSASAATATEAGIIYRSNGDWVSGPYSEFSSATHDAPLDYDGVSTNLGSTNTIGTAGWQSMPRALLTSQGTPVRWFVEHGVVLEDGHTWDDADGYDSDTNGVVNRAEYVAGTDPLDASSVLEILGTEVIPAGTNLQIDVTWAGARGGATNTIWQMFGATNGIDAPIWEQVSGGNWTIPGTGTNIWSWETAPLGSPMFFRLEAKAP